MQYLILKLVTYMYICARRRRIVARKLDGETCYKTGTELYRMEVKFVGRRMREILVLQVFVSIICFLPIAGPRHNSADIA
jgi:hypothetical protein